MTDMITIPRSELQQALDALELCYEGKASLDTVPNAAEALRARLAQPEPELWGCKFNKGKRVDTFYTKSAAERYVEGASRNGADVSLVGLYTAPPRREWVGLTEEEFSHGIQMASNTSWMNAAKWVEAKLKEKNS